MPTQQSKSKAGSVSEETHLPKHIREAQEIARKHNALKTTRAKQKEQVKLLEEIPLEIAKAARNLHQVIKLWYPIDGQPWNYAQSKTASLALNAECEVYNSQLQFLRLLDHDREPTQSDSEGCPIRFARWPPALIRWRDLIGALEKMANDNHLIALHYGWTDLLYNDRGPLPHREWSKIPAIPAPMLQALLDDAERIETLTLPPLEKIRNELANPRAGRPKNTEKDSATKAITALNKHHGYDDGSVTNLKPATNRGLHNDYGVSSNALSRFLKDRFPDETKPDAKYKAACRDAARLGALLKLWNRDFPEHYAPLHDEEEGEVTKTSSRRRAGQTPGSHRDAD